ncbi:MAG: hypothetical protein RLZZ273_1200 [Bacteroidota bacterium]|jgi:uncharacterized protein (DUF1800 family)
MSSIDKSTYVEAMENLEVRTSPLTIDDALHLLRRATFHPTYQAAKALVGLAPSEAVSRLLSTPVAPLADLPWATTAPNYQDFAANARLWPEMQQWWMQRVLSVPHVHEKLIVFWHNVFTSDYIRVYIAQWMVNQHKLIRSNATNYAVLAEKIVGDPAMLRYLDGELNVKGRPNENFAREWFELFTLGIGNYTEQDIQDAARAFTGWRINGVQGVYSKQLADTDTKTILGKTGQWDWKDVVRITLESDVCARYIAKRIVKQFVEFYPTDDTITNVQQIVRSANYDMVAILQRLLSSEYFYTMSVRGALIKSPAELVVGLAASIGALRVQPSYCVASMTKLTQEPFYPPTVEGWKGHHAWITSSTFPQRQRFAEAFIDGRQAGSSAKLLDAEGKNFTPDVVAMVLQLPDADDAAKLVAHVASLMLAVPVTQKQLSVLLEIMLAGAQVYEWNVNSPSAPQRIKFLLQAIVRMPEYQLM